MHDDLSRVSTGVAGLDEILCGGLLPRQAYLVRGGPGTGKTILGLHFLSAGAQMGEPVLFITLSEPEEEIRKRASRVNIPIEGIHFLDLSPTPEFFVQVETYDLFSPAEVEREPTTQRIVQTVTELKPKRVFVDSMTQFRYLAVDPFQYRKQVLSFLRFLLAQGATVLFTSEGSVEAPDDHLRFLADGVIELALGPGGRSISVTKFRGSAFLEGRHSLKLGEEGMQVFPKVVPGRRREFAFEPLSSGVAELDSLLGGGLERGTTTIITGPSGVGKTTCGLLFIAAAASRGERSALYSFEEEIDSIITRAEGVKIPARRMIDQGELLIEKIEPLLYTAEEFAQRVRNAVEEGVRIVMIDSVSGYRLALRGEDLVAQLHALCNYLNNVGVTVLLINEVEEITGEFRPTGAGLSYLADNLIFLRYYEVQGELRRAIGVLKKRLSDFEKTVRDFQITAEGIKVGRPLVELRGILTGVPELVERPRAGEG